MQPVAATKSAESNYFSFRAYLPQTIINGPGIIYRSIDSAIQSKQGVASKAFEVWYQTCNFVIQAETWVFDGLRADVLIPRVYAMPICIVMTIGYKSLELLPDPTSKLGAVYQDIQKIMKSSSFPYIFRVANYAADTFFFQFDVMYHALLINLRPIPEASFCFALGVTIYAAIKHYGAGQKEENTSTLLKQIGDTLFLASFLMSRVNAFNRAFAPVWFPSAVVIAIAALTMLSYAIGKQIHGPTEEAKETTLDEAPSTDQPKSSTPNVDTRTSTASAVAPEIGTTTGYLETALGGIAHGAHSLFNRVEKLRHEKITVQKGFIIINRASRIILYGVDVITIPMLNLIAPQVKDFAYIALGLAGLVYGIAEAQATVSTKKKKVA